MTWRMVGHDLYNISITTETWHPLSFTPFNLQQKTPRLGPLARQNVVLYQETKNSE